MKTMKLTCEIKPTIEGYKYHAVLKNWKDKNGKCDKKTLIRFYQIIIKHLSEELKMMNGEI